MVNMGVIAKVEEPTDWVAPIVPVIKPSGAVRICVDLTELNKNIRRPKIMLPDVEETLGSIGRSVIFSKLDAQSGFWQVKLDPSTAHLTTFITPFGRYYFKRLPFGISSAPEYFQNVMNKLLEGLEGVVILMDDILIHATDIATHNERLEAVLQRLAKHKVVLNRDKCIFSARKIKFLGHVIDGMGVRIDPERISALEKLPTPKNVSDIRRINGMLNQISKFIP